MKAIIKASGKQYLVEKGQVLKLDKMEGAEGDKVTFEEVLLTTDGDKTNVGAGNIAGAKVEGKILFQGKDDKKIVYKMQPKKRYSRLKGHRQMITEVEITAIHA